MSDHSEKAKNNADLSSLVHLKKKLEREEKRREADHIDAYSLEQPDGTTKEFKRKKKCIDTSPRASKRGS